MSIRKDFEELVYIDLENDECLFYNVELLSVGYNQMQVITTSGRIKTQGKSHVTRFEGENSFKDAKKFFLNRIFEKKDSGYKRKKKMNEYIKAYDKNKPNKKLPHKIPSESPVCDICSKPINSKLYRKINDWARGDANWDYDSSFIGYKKIICIDCQVEHGIYLKKFPLKEKKEKSEKK